MGLDLGPRSAGGRTLKGFRGCDLETGALTLNRQLNDAPFPPLACARAPEQYIVYLSCAHTHTC